MAHYEIDNKQLLEDFISLVSIDSPSGKERQVADWMTKQLSELGCEVHEDDAGPKAGADAGNLIVRLPGNVDADPILFSAHMDTVTPADGVEPIIEDGVVRSKGDTILGADDKAGLAVIVQLARLAKDQPDVPRPPLEFSIHISEEVGLLGAKNLDTSQLKSKFGYVLDDEDINIVCTGSPGAARLDYTVYGKAAHAGVAPEKGISALKVAAEAIAKMKMGRLDEETTANIGKIEGGSASNVVTPRVSMKAEARSHDPEKLEAQVAHMDECFESVCAEWRERSGEDLPRWEVDRGDDYQAVSFTEDDEPIKLAMAAGESIGLEMGTKISGGGTDGSIMTHKGIPCVVIGVGMRNIHSTDEYIEIADLETAARYISRIVELHAGSARS